MEGNSQNNLDLIHINSDLFKLCIPLSDTIYLTVKFNRRIGVGKVDASGHFIARKNVEGTSEFWAQVFKGLCHHSKEVAYCQPYRYMVKNLDSSGDRAKGYFLSGIWYDPYYRTDIRFQRLDTSVSTEWQSGRGVSLELAETHSLLLNFMDAAKAGTWQADDEKTLKSIDLLSDLLLNSIAQKIRTPDTELLVKLDDEGKKLMNPATYELYLNKENVKSDIPSKSVLYYRPTVILLAQSKLMSKKFANGPLDRAFITYADLVANDRASAEGALDYAAKHNFFGERPKSGKATKKTVPADASAARDSTDEACPTSTS